MPSAYQTHEEKPLFERGLPLFTRGALLIILGVALIASEQRITQIQTLRSHLALAAYPLQIIAAVPNTVGGWLSSITQTRSNLADENQRLKQQQLIQNAKLQKMAALQAENNRIRKLLDSAERIEEKVLIAEIVAVDIDPYQHKVVINKGALHGAFIGQALVDSHGIAGQLVEVSLLTSTALLITDTEHAIPIVNNRTGVQTIVDGTGNAGRLKLQWLGNDEDAQPGDLLVTSGLGGRFPGGYPVGTITFFQKNLGKEFATVYAKPAAKISRSREVLLVWSSSSESISGLGEQ